MQNLVKYLLLFLIFLSLPLFGHEKHHHKPDPSKEPKAKTESQEKIISQINQSYVTNIKPIFEQKCNNCHGGATKYPWYYNFPFAKDLIDSDIAEAKKHLDFSQNFPFKGHGTPIEDLEAIAKSVTEGTMPPFRYWALHWDARLTEEDKKNIKAWVDSSLSLLNK